MSETRNSKDPVARQSTPVATFIVAAVLIVYWLVLFLGTHIRVPPGMMPGNSDKFIHFGAYAVLGVLLMSLRATRGIYPWFSVIARWLVLAGYGAFDELTQMLVKRNADIIDWLADLAGAAVGLGFVTFVLWWFRKPKVSISQESAATEVVPS